MKKMTLKVIANCIIDGKRNEICETQDILIADPPEKKDSSSLSKIIKNLFEDALDMPVIVKTRIKSDSVTSSVSIKELSP